MPSLPQISATVTPLSACCNAKTICDTMNLDSFHGNRQASDPVITCPLFSILFGRVLREEVTFIRTDF
jgi:hypothetical protein